MNLLLDTHVSLWFVSGDPSLSTTSKDLIVDPNSLIFLSTASMWAMAIKVSINKLAVPSPLQSFLDREMVKNGIPPLGITPEHADKVATLPFPQSGHRDPFDRLIIAQSLIEGYPVTSKDAVFDEYEVECYW